MPFDPNNTVRLRPPFGGLNEMSPARAVGPLDAALASNVVAGQDGIRVRPFMATVANLGLTPPGTTNYRLAFPLVPWRRQDGSRMLYLADHWSTSAYPATIGAFQGVLTASFALATSYGAGDPTPIMRGVAVKNAIYSGYANISPGTRGRKFYFRDSDSTWIQATIGIPAPVGTASFQNLGDSAALTPGTYSYRFTYYNGTLDSESGPSPESIDIISGPGNYGVRMNLDGLYWFTEPQVTAIRVYRMKVGVDDTWYFVGQYNGGMIGGHYAYDDSLPTPTKDYTNRLDTSIGMPPPRISAMAWHRGRMWYAPAYAFQPLVYSDIDRPDQVQQLDGYNVGDQNEFCSALVSFGGYLWAFTAGSVSIISGNAPDNFTVDPLDTTQYGAGCLSQHSIVEAERALYFVAPDGIYRIDSDRPELLTAALRWPQDVGAPGSSSQWVGHDAYAASGAFDEYRGLLLFNVWFKHKPRQFVYSLVTKGWTMWNADIHSVAMFQGAADERAEMHYARPTSPTGTVQIGKFNWSSTGGDFGTTPVAWAWHSGQLDLGTSLRKHLLRMRVSWQPIAGSSDTFTAIAKCEDTTPVVVSAASSIGAPNGQAVVRAGLRGDRFAYELRGEATAQANFTGVELDAEPIGA